MQSASIIQYMYAGDLVLLSEYPGRIPTRHSKQTVETIQTENKFKTFFFTEPNFFSIEVEQGGGSHIFLKN